MEESRPAGGLVPSQSNRPGSAARFPARRQWGMAPGRVAGRPQRDRELVPPRGSLVSRCSLGAAGSCREAALWQEPESPPAHGPGMDGTGQGTRWF